MKTIFILAFAIAVSAITIFISITPFLTAYKGGGPIGAVTPDMENKTRVTGISMNACNPDIINEKMQEKSYSVNEQKAISLAQSQPEVISKTIFFGYHYDSIANSYSWDDNCTLTLTSVNVVFQSNNHDLGPVVVTEDPTLGKVIKIDVQEAHYFGGPRQ
jgi:hypothetical protein